MIRRRFLALFAGLGCCLGQFVAGCRRADQGVAADPPSRRRRSPEEVQELIRRRILGRVRAIKGIAIAPDSIVVADLDAGDSIQPVTLISVLAVCSIIQGLFYLCQLISLLRQHAAVQKNPKGGVAAKLKRKLAAQYHEENPGALPGEVDLHAQAAVESFAEASPDEIRDLWHDIQAIKPDTPTLISRAELAAELSGAEVP